MKLLFIDFVAHESSLLPKDLVLESAMIDRRRESASDVDSAFVIAYAAKTPYSLLLV